MYYDKFDICAAHYWFAAGYHTGKSSKLYQKLGQLILMGFRISPLSNSINDESDNAQTIYNNLVKQVRKQHE